MYLKFQSYLYDQHKEETTTYLLICNIQTISQEDPVEIYLKVLGKPDEILIMSTLVTMKLNETIVKAELKEMYSLINDKKPEHVSGDLFSEFAQLVRERLK